MWQRVQTLYLLISTALIASLFFCCKVGDITYISSTPYLVLLIIISLLNILALTTYKQRIFQMRTAVLSALITLGLQAWLVVDYFSSDKSSLFSFTAVFPIVAVIFDFMAAWNIFSDELVVRSASRLRTAKRKNR